MRHKLNLSKLIIILLVLIGLVNSLSLNETETLRENEFVNGTEGVEQVNSRNSRQLWSLFKNVVKSSLDKGASSGDNNNNANPVSGGGLGALASLFGSAIASANKGGGVSSSSLGNGGHLQSQSSHVRPYIPSYPPPNQYTNPNEYMHWLLLNSQQNQHASVPHYQVQQQKKEHGIQELIEKYKEQMQSSGSENVEIGTGSEGVGNTGSQILNKLAFGGILDNLDLDNLGNLLSFGRFEDMVAKVNKFDRLKCIPRLLCQMVAKRQEDAKASETTTTTARPTKAKRRQEDMEEVSEEEKIIVDDEKASDNKKRYDKSSGSTEGQDGNEENANTEKPKTNEKVEKVSQEDQTKKKDSGEEEEEQDEDGDDDDDDDDDESSEEERRPIRYEIIKPGNDKEDSRQGRSRQGRIFKFNGADLALEQFVKFLELMQLKDWSLYPYLNGAYQGHQVSRSEDCAYRFSTCPFSDDQLVYYFNNYNNGIFHSIF